MKHKKVCQKEGSIRRKKGGQQTPALADGREKVPRKLGSSAKPGRDGAGRKRERRGHGLLAE